jgi:hypothetical protein
MADAVKDFLIASSAMKSKLVSGAAFAELSWRAVTALLTGDFSKGLDGVPPLAERLEAAGRLRNNVKNNQKIDNDVASSTYSTYCSLALPVYYIP